MSCRNLGINNDNCVCTILTKIVDFQNQDNTINSNDCIVSCDKSIQEVLGVPFFPISESPNTIPIILFCGCEPFLGFGIKMFGAAFTCFKSFIFRVSSVDDEDCCAVLELLQTTQLGTPPPTPLNDPCDQFPSIGFQKTGICITVDLSCICGVSCLEPVRL